MALLEPKIAILDETDSGLDIDALRIVASGIKKISNAQTGIILITHYQRLLDDCLLYTSPSPRDLSTSRMPSSA